MKKIPIFFQVFIYMMSLTTALLIVVFVIQRQFIPMIYQEQRQSDMHAEIVEINRLLMNADYAEHASIVSNFNSRTTYELYVFDVYGKAVFSNQSADLRTSTIIELNQQAIENDYFDGLIPYLLRIEKTDLYIYQLSIPTEGLYQTIRAINSLYIYILIIGLLVSTLFAFIFSNNISRPINKLKKMSESLGEKSLLIERNDEIGSLSKALESLRVSLNDSIQELERELEREKKQDTLSKQFIANVSHEYQTPLAVMLAAIETLIDHDNFTKKEKDHYFSMITREAKHLEALSKDMLLLSQTHIITPIDETVELNQVISEVVSELKMIFTDVKVHVKASEESNVVKIGKQHIKQIVENVINNAMRHQTDQSVYIDVGIDAKGAYLSVENHTDILVEDDLAHIMDPFYKKASRGHGIGLAIIKNLLSIYRYHYVLSLKKQRFSIKINFWSRLL